MQHLKSIIFSFVFLLIVGGAEAQCISTFPYTEDFETGTGNWVSGGLNNDWAWGHPSKPVISGAGSGQNCWITGGLTNSFYTGSEKSWIESPCFDFSSLTSPYIRFLIFWDTERVFDGGNFQYSLNAGSTWLNLGAYNEPGSCVGSNWFNTDDVRYISGLSNPNSNGWSGNTQTSTSPCRGTGGSGKWVEAYHCMQFLAGEPTVTFRFTFGAGSSCNGYDGLAFDSVFIGDTPTPVIDFSIVCIDSKTISVTANVSDCPSAYEWDFGEPGSQGNIGTLQTETHTYSGNGNFIVQLKTDFQCAPPVTKQDNISVTDIEVMTYPVTCKDGNDGAASVKVTGVSNPLISWNTNPIQNADSIFNINAGTYVVTVSSMKTCTNSSQVFIKYAAGAFPIADLGADQRVCPGSELVLDPGNFKFYEWSDGSVLPQFTVTNPGIYWVDVTDSAGCMATDTLFVKEGCGDNVWVPGAFSPDNDGKNDVFTAKGISISNYNLKVFNRWGQLVFSSSDPLEGWDGNYGGQQASMGIYGYTLRYKLYDGKSYQQEGTVLLIR
jgi:gliding motility-associated-like protein